MLKVYDPWEYAFEQWHTQKVNQKLLYYASDLIDMLGIMEEKELITVLNRTFRACSSLQISIEENFEHIYRNVDNGLISDWKLSSLACYLLTINANPANPNVAKAQLFFAEKIVSY